jgi:hypothetical protein
MIKKKYLLKEIAELQKEVFGETSDCFCLSSIPSLRKKIEGVRENLQILGNVNNNLADKVCALYKHLGLRFDREISERNVVSKAKKVAVKRNKK